MPSFRSGSASFEQIKELEQEQAQRLAIRCSLSEWARLALAQAGQEPAAHHHLLLKELESLSRGEIDRLMVLMPPGSAKSTYASVIFPAWWFTQHPSSAIIAASHTADLAEHFGRQVRNLVAEHGPRLGYALAVDNRAAARWQIVTSGQYFATGVRGPITGRRADLAIIDDPVKSQAEADNAYFRDHVWNWYRSDLTTRLKPGGRIVLIMTRWHEDDLGGRLLATQAAEWRTLRLPALAEEDDPLGRAPGDPLWPEWENAAALARKRAAVGERVFAALFQQSPLPPSGAMFKVGQIAFLDDPPSVASGRSVRAWDIAATKESGSSDPDWTVGLKLHLNERGGFTVLDVVRLRGTVHEVNQAVLQTARTDGIKVPIGIPQDPGSAGKFMVQQFASLLAGYNLVCSPENGPKTSRAAPVSAQVEAGNLAVLRASWTHALLEELREFPHGRKDDQVDALSRAFVMLTDTGIPSRRLNVPLMAR
jgi:predicted phage terminase large subunit-like protein